MFFLKYYGDPPLGCMIDPWSWHRFTCCSRMVDQHFKHLQPMFECFFIGVPMRAGHAIGNPIIAMPLREKNNIGLIVFRPFNDDTIVLERCPFRHASIW